MQKSLLATALALALPAAAEEPQAAPPAAPDPEFLVFLGETGGVDADFVLYMDTHDAKKALKQAQKETPKDDHHE
jgi:hypothetical protein